MFPFFVTFKSLNQVTLHSSVPVEYYDILLQSRIFYYSRDYILLLLQLQIMTYNNVNKAYL